MAAKSIILRAKLEGVLTELMVKTNAANVYVDENTTLAAHLQTLAKQADLTTLQQTVDALGALASKDKVSEADLDEALTALLGAKAEKSVVDTLVGSDTGKSVRTIANEELAAKLIPADAAESLNTLEEIAKWIQDHPDDASAMNAAIAALQSQMAGIAAGEGTVKKYVDDAITALKIGDYAKAADLTALAGRVDGLDSGKADKATTLGGYGITDAYTTAQTDQKIADALSAATGGESAAAVKGQLDAYKTSNDARVDALEADTHTHANKTVLDGVTAEKVTAWDNKSTIHYGATEPAAMADGDLWVQIVE